jgi:phosphoglycerate dehydrogenase-like enzyme
MKILFPTSTDFDFTKHEPGITYIPYEPREPIPEEHLDAEVLVVWLNSRRHLNTAAGSMPNLRLVQGLMAGVDSLIAAGFPPGIPISNGRGLHDLTVAEHTLALLLAAARRLHHLRDAQNQKRWLRQDDPEYPDHDVSAFSTLRSSRITIWGFGSIAASLAPQLKALGATVTGIATSAGERAGFPVIANDDIDDLLPETDALVMILPESAATTNLLDARRLELLPSHAWVVNVGRGNSINETDLAQALASGTIGGAALDVFAEEPLPQASPLWELPNLILSPHAAGNIPIGAEELVRDNVRRLQAGEPLRNVIDREKGY